MKAKAITRIIQRALAALNALAWACIAWLVTRPPVTAWLIRRAQRTPYSHIRSKDGTSIYMRRWWLFNPYDKDDDGEQKPARFEWLPSIRVHHILRPDIDRDLHDHPWNARTIVLRGWYKEERYKNAVSRRDEHKHCVEHYRPAKAWDTEGQIFKPPIRAVLLREQGYTGRLLFGEYHRIKDLPVGGVYTLFFIWRYRGSWGFDVNGRKIHHADYHEVRQ
jgi:hypothetical protein